MVPRGRRRTAPPVGRSVPCLRQDAARRTDADRRPCVPQCKSLPVGVDGAQGAKYLAGTGSHMKQLSGLDNVFLRLERGNQHMHVAGLAIYDPSSAPGGEVRFKDVLRFFEARLDASPIFRRRLVEVPAAADRPYWVEDADIDVEFHVRHIA